MEVKSHRGLSLQESSSVAEKNEKMKKMNSVYI